MHGDRDAKASSSLSPSAATAAASGSPDDTNNSTSAATTTTPVAKGKQSVRKRFTTPRMASISSVIRGGGSLLTGGAASASVYHHHHNMPNHRTMKSKYHAAALLAEQHYQKHYALPTTWKVQLKNFLLFLAMSSFPIGIFVASAWAQAPQAPRVVISLYTTPEQLPYLEPTLESLLRNQKGGAATGNLSPHTAAVYLILPQERSIGDNGESEELNYEPLPDFLKAYQEPSTSSSYPLLQILQPKWDYGPISRVLYALEQEESSLRAEAASRLQEEAFEEDGMAKEERSSTTTTTAPSDTRLILVDDHIVYPNTFLRELVDASESFPQEAIAGSGGNLRSFARQFLHVQPHSSAEHNHRQYNLKQRQEAPTGAHQDYRVLDKVPNVILHASDSYFLEDGPPPSVDVLESYGGLVLPTQGLQVQPLAQLLERLRLEAPGILQAPASQDVVLSGLLQAQNVTRKVLPLLSSSQPLFWNQTTSRITVAQDQSHTTKVEDRAVAAYPPQVWLEALWALQSELGIWSEYSFWDWKSLTKEQQDGIDCEAEAWASVEHADSPSWIDCTSHTTQCRLTVPAENEKHDDVPLSQECQVAINAHQQALEDLSNFALA